MQTIKKAFIALFRRFFDRDKLDAGNIQQLQDILDKAMRDLE